MIFNFRKLLICTFSISMASLTVNADCLGSYNQIASLVIVNGDSGVEAAFSIGGNGIPMVYGASTSQQGGALFVPPVSGTTAAAGGTAGAMTSGGVVAAAVPVSSTGYSVVQSYRRNQARKIVRLINEADIGNGLMLLEVSAELSNHVGKNITVSTLASTISKANKDNVFCPNSNTLYSQDDIYTFLAAELK